MSKSYLIVGSVETFGTTMLNGPLLFAWPSSELVSHGRPLSTTANANIVPAHVFNLVACMANPQGWKAGTEEEGRAFLSLALGSGYDGHSVRGEW